MTREEARALADRVLALARARADPREHHQRVGRATPDLPTRASPRRAVITDIVVTVTITIGASARRRKPTCSTTPRLRRTVDLAAQLARLSPDDPELMPELGPQSYAP